MMESGAETLFGRLRRCQAAAPIAAAALRCTGSREQVTRLRPRSGAFNPAAADLVLKWKQP